MVLTACGNASKTKEKAGEHEDHLAENMGDIREETESADVLPTFLDDKHENMQTLYKVVAQNQELLEQMPCYCGCGDSVGHKDNYDCFVHENKETAVVWDDHGTKCGVCLEIAAEAIMKFEKGDAVKDIRKAIDEKYKEGYAEPTPTQAI